MKNNPFFTEGSEEEFEFMPILPLNEDQPDDLGDDKIPDTIPILPLRNTVLFPGVILPITVGRDKSIMAVQDANKADKLIGVVSQKESSVEDPSISDLADIGTVARIVKLIRMPDGGTTIIIQGRRRFQVSEILEEEPYFKAKINLLEDEWPSKNEEKEFNAYSASIRELAGQIITLSTNIPSEATVILSNIENPSFLIHFVASNLSSDLKEKQQNESGKRDFQYSQ